MPSHYGKHGTRREYLRHNPTDWRERAMGAVRRKKKKTNIVTNKDDVRSTAGTGAGGTQGGPATRRNYPKPMPKPTPPDKKKVKKEKKTQQKISPHKVDTKTHRLLVDENNKKKTRLSNKTTKYKHIGGWRSGNVLDNIVKANMKAYPDAYAHLPDVKQGSKKKKKTFSLGRMLKSLLKSTADHDRTGGSLKTIVKKHKQRTQK